MTPERHSALTSGGNETRNIGAPIAGTESACLSAFGKVMAGLGHHAAAARINSSTRPWR